MSFGENLQTVRKKDPFSQEGITVLSPDKKTMLSCRNGLKVDGGTILVQADKDWNPLCCYNTPEEALTGMNKIREAMLKGIPYLER